MNPLAVCAFVALTFWVGGLTLFDAVVIPALFRALPREEAGRTAGLLFPAVERWISVWALVACVALLFFFRDRHWEVRSLVLELPVAVMAAFTLYSAWILQPEIQEVRGRMQQPEFQGTTHLEKLRFSFDWFHRLSVRLHGIILFLGWLTLTLLPRFLR